MDGIPCQHRGRHILFVMIDPGKRRRLEEMPRFRARGHSRMLCRTTRLACPHPSTLLPTCHTWLLITMCTLLTVSVAAGDIAG